MRKVNETRVSASIPRRLIRERRFHLLPLYFLLRTSELGREGIDHSGSHHFADHLYRRTAKGRFGVGILVDAILLSMVSSRSFRNRFLHARDEVLRSLQSREEATSIRVLSVPSGIPRELLEAALMLRSSDPEILSRTTFYCLDIDQSCLAEARALADGRQLPNFQFIAGDAFDPRCYPHDLDVITTTGFGDFLSDDEWVRFYSLCYERLRPGGLLVSSAARRHRLSAYLMEEVVELRAIYREEPDLLRLFARTPFRQPVLCRDAVGYQILISATKDYNANLP